MWGGGGQGTQKEPKEKVKVQEGVRECCPREQCDQMPRSFFNSWPFTTVNMCTIPIVKSTKVGSKRGQILTN